MLSLIKNRILGNAYLLLVSLFLFYLSVNAQTKNTDEYLIYKTTVQRDLGISMYLPSKRVDKDSLPLVVFFHGGGWKNGAPEQFRAQAEYFKERGAVCALVEYRTQEADGTDPFAALADAKSAVRFLKKRAEIYHIDTTKIVLAGGSAGGQLAAACQWVRGFDDPTDDLSISTKGETLVLFNPVVDNGPNGYGYSRVKDKYVQFSPFHQTKKDSTNVLIICGTKDKLIPVSTLEELEYDVNHHGGRCKLVWYEEEGHGFFNRPPYNQKTREDMDDFLVDIGILPKRKKPNILWITYEDTSPQFIGCYGSKISTPVIDSLARKGIRLTNAFSTGAVCSPSRTAIITGVKTYQTGTGHHRSKYKIPEFIKGFPYYLQQNGYFTSNNHKTDYNVFDEQGFIGETWNESSETTGWWNRKPGQPFFSVFNFMESHQSRTMTEPYEWYVENVYQHIPEAKRIKEDEIDLPPYYHNSPEMRKQFARVYNSVRLTDIRIGELLKKLEADGLTDSTVIFIFSDHGQGIPRAKTNGIAMGYKVPFIIWVPDDYRYLLADMQTDELVDFTDLAPTILSLTESKIPEHLHGRPFLGRLKKSTPRQLFLSSDRADNGQDMVRSVTNGRYIYSRNFMPFFPELRYIRYMEIAEMKQIMRRDFDNGVLNDFQKSLFSSRPPEVLYDLEEDKWEKHNLALDSAYDSLLVSFRNSMLKELEETKDVMFLPEYELARLQESTTAYEYRQTDSYPIKEIINAAMLVGLQGKVVAKRQISLLDHENKIIRYWAITGLRSQSPEILKTYRKKILGALEDGYPPIEILAAVISYDEFDNDKARKQLESFCLSKNEHIAVATINHLLYLKKQQPFIDKIQHVLKQERSVPVRSACFDFLGAHELVPNTIKYLD